MDQRHFAVISLTATANEPHDLFKLLGRHAIPVVRASESAEVGRVRGHMHLIRISVKGVAHQFFQ